MDRDTFLKELANAGFAIDDGPPDARLLLDEALSYLDEITLHESARAWWHDRSNHPRARSPA
jgi:hypothetical protein